MEAKEVAPCTWVLPDGRQANVPGDEHSAKQRHHVAHWSPVWWGCGEVEGGPGTWVEVGLRRLPLG